MSSSPPSAYRERYLSAETGTPKTAAGGRHSPPRPAATSDAAATEPDAATKRQAQELLQDERDAIDAPALIGWYVVPFAFEHVAHV